MSRRGPVRTLLASCVAQAWSNLVLPRLGSGIRGRTFANAAFATAYAAVFDGRPEWLSRRGFTWGAVVFGAVGAAYGVGLAVPGIRDRIAGVADRAPEVSTAEWVGLHIPVGTVYSEELIFRGTLDRLFEDAGPVRRHCGALVFGLWHIHPARSAGDSVPVTVAVTTAGGLFFSWLRRRTGSATAPALAHLALNAGGALVPRAARALRDRRAGTPLRGEGGAPR
ncbi:CPBP family intramembrane glutamic endopeptidase [Nocardia kruczakiae]|uniref:CPBP family intramembrane glutamic endopeptidase n=1 Tax=Nocardia kruczakiae TaxID=261477 RepID=UPI0007A45AE9|nr:CPBP family intramembrane glutamic endopeptidase [Nocardia kruczakiae]